jgi:hypothetical protein
VDESRATGCDVWRIRVCVEWNAETGPPGSSSNVRIRYSLDDFDCRNLTIPPRKQ